MPRLIFCKVTKGCNLCCIHCRATATELSSSLELPSSKAHFIKQVSPSFLPTRVLSGGKPIFRYDISEPYSTSFGVHLGRTSLLGCAPLFTHQGGDPSHQIGSSVRLARHGRDLSPRQACGVTPAQPGTQAQRRGCRASSQQPPGTPGVGPPSPGI